MNAKEMFEELSYRKMSDCVGYTNDYVEIKIDPKANDLLTVETNLPFRFAGNSDYVMSLMKAIQTFMIERGLMEKNKDGK